MKTTTAFAVLLVLGLSACDDTASRLAHAAKVCEKAEQLGQLDVAEDYCQRALGEPGEEQVLEPEVRSARLYRLARIKRQRAKFSEADGLLKQSLAIEESLSGPESPQVAGRLLERSLVLAGLGQWEDGVRTLERAMPHAGQLTDKERRSMVHISKRYAEQLRKTQQAAQAERIEAAAAQLSQQEPPGQP